MKKILLTLVFALTLLSAKALPYVVNLGGLATNTIFYPQITTNSASTNLFYGFGSSDPLVNGTYALTAALGADGQALYTNMNGSGRVMVVDCCASDFNAFYSIVQNTNGDISTWIVLIEHSVPQPGGAWSLGGDGTTVPFTASGWGTWNPPLRVVGQMQADALNLTNLNGANLRAGSVSQAALASGITVPTSQTLSNKFIHIRTNGVTINNTNWIFQGNVSGSRVTITNNDFYAYSTNGAFANVRYLDQILFNDINVQCVVHQVINANKVQCWQLNVGNESKTTAGVTNASNWYLIPYMFKLTDFTVGAENYPTVFDSNGSLRLSGIDNQGSVTFHNANGTAIQMAADTSPLAGLPMGPSGMYFTISSVGVSSDGSGFVNAQQFVLPAETLREAQIFATNGPVTFQYGYTNIKGGNLDFRSKAVAVVGFEGNGSGLTNVTANAPTVIQTNFVPGFLYSNNSGRPQEAKFTAVLTLAAVTGSATIEARIGVVGTTTNYASVPTGAAVVTGADKQTMSVAIPIGATYTLTNTSSGAGNSATISGGQLTTF